MTEFFTVVVLHMFAVMSPGPDFFLVSRQSIRYGRKIALWTAGGIGTGILFHSGFAVTGMLIILSSNDFYLLFLKFICSFYLIYLGFTSLLNVSSFDEDIINKDKWGRAGGFTVGLITNITNIKALLFFISLFGIVLSSSSNFSLMLYGLYMAVMTFVWFASVSYIFTSNIFKEKFLKFFGVFEKFLGFALVIIALQILLSEFI